MRAVTFPNQDFVLKLLVHVARGLATARAALPPKVRLPILHVRLERLPASLSDDCERFELRFELTAVPLVVPLCILRLVWVLASEAVEGGEGEPEEVVLECLWESKPYIDDGDGGIELSA